MSEYSKKPLSDKHQTNATAVISVVLPVVTVSHSSAQPAAVASDANVSTFSLVSVGPYEEFAVSIMFLFVTFPQSTFCTFESHFPCGVFGLAMVVACMDLFMH